MFVMFLQDIVMQQAVCHQYLTKPVAVVLVRWVKLYWQSRVREDLGNKECSQNFEVVICKAKEKVGVTDLWF
jgi:hypothetical protein